METGNQGVRQQVDAEADKEAAHVSVHGPAPFALAIHARMLSPTATASPMATTAPTDAARIQNGALSSQVAKITSRPPASDTSSDAPMGITGQKARAPMPMTP